MALRKRVEKVLDEFEGLDYRHEDRFWESRNGREAEEAERGGGELDGERLRNPGRLPLVTIRAAPLKLSLQ